MVKVEPAHVVVGQAAWRTSREAPDRRPERGAIGRPHRDGEVGSADQRGRKNAYVRSDSDDAQSAREIVSYLLGAD